MATCWLPPGPQNNRSPRLACDTGPLRPVLYWSPEYLGISTPTPAYANWVNPEQSKPTVLAPESTPVLGPLGFPPPHEYGTPIWDAPRRITYSIACGPRTRPAAAPVGAILAGAPPMPMLLKNFRPRTIVAWV